MSGLAELLGTTAEQTLMTTPVLVYALIDDEPGDKFLLGVFRSKERAEAEAGEWPGPSHIEVLVLED